MSGREGLPRRRFQLHHGLSSDRAGYVVTDSWQKGPDWRGLVLFRTDSRSDAEAKADELNAVEDDR